jgi:hypothetical protein
VWKPRLIYDAAGRLQRTETGTVDGLADGQWSTFQPSVAQEVVYDTYGRVTQSRTSGGGVTLSLTETRYDSAGRVECVAQRMNAGALNAAPSSACDAGTPGADGPDRITRTSYDPANRRIEVTNGYGTSAASTEVSVATPNGKSAWIRDGELNRTSYVYDGHDRLSETHFPVANKGGDASSASDYEKLSYDVNGNVRSRRLRDNQTFSFTYDNLNRRTYANNPNTSVAETDATYTYDTSGQLLEAR